MKKRKNEHIEICLNKKIESGSAGFEKYRFIHNALPEIDIDEINISTLFIGKKINAPIMVSPMTGGTNQKKININLAKAAEKVKIPMSVGSQRIMYSDPKTQSDFLVRKYAPSIPIIANLGAVQLNYELSLDDCKNAVESINANALALHLNPLQEAIQVEGQRNFQGLLEKIGNLVKNFYYPIIIKEVGTGISAEVGKLVKDVGIRIIDVSGYGGTNWALIEGIRAHNRLGETFKEWGIPTTQAIIRNKELNIELIAGGGIRSGIDIAKAICLGADFVSIALPLLKPASISAKKVEEKLNQYIQELKIAMFCIGVKNLEELKNTDKLVKLDTKSI